MAYERFLPVLISVDALSEQRVQNPIVEESAVTLRLARPYARDDDQVANSVPIHCEKEKTCRIREERRVSNVAGAKRVDDDVLSMNSRRHRVWIESVAMDDPYTSHERAPFRRPDESRNLVTAPQGFVDDQASYAARCAKNQHSHGSRIMHAVVQCRQMLLARRLQSRVTLGSRLEEIVEETQYGLRVELPVSYEQAVERATLALKEQGFGVLTTIDVKTTLKQKLDRDFRKYVILGACNPPLANRALHAELEIGLLLPCNVIVYELGPGRSAVSAMAPLAALGIVGDNSTLQEVAKEADARLRNALTTLEKTTASS